MHLLFKVAWVLRALAYSPFFKGFPMPGYLGKPCFLMGVGRMRLGRKVRIFPGLRAECLGAGTLTIGDNVSIGQGFHVIAKGDLKIGSHVLISSNVLVTDTEHTYLDVARPVLDQEDVVSRTEIGDRCFIGVGACIQAGTILGAGCVIGSHAVVRGVFPPNSVIVGSPAKIVRRYDESTAKWERIAR
ncbi:lipopolysaccharide biosynthesis protein [Stenotrophomonas maltophilia]|nr:lipopolysaccharide biosynthesis protein [Stenotrophomonas maltophilia]